MSISYGNRLKVQAEALGHHRPASLPPRRSTGGRWLSVGGRRRICTIASVSFGHRHHRRRITRRGGRRVGASASICIPCIASSIAAGRAAGLALGRVTRCVTLRSATTSNRPGVHGGSHGWMKPGRGHIRRKLRRPRDRRHPIARKITRRHGCGLIRKRLAWCTRSRSPGRGWARLHRRAWVQGHTTTGQRNPTRRQGWEVSRTISILGPAENIL